MAGQTPDNGQLDSNVEVLIAVNQLPQRCIKLKYALNYLVVKHRLRKIRPAL